MPNQTLASPPRLILSASGPEHADRELVPPSVSRAAFMDDRASCLVSPRASCQTSLEDIFARRRWSGNSGEVIFFESSDDAMRPPFQSQREGRLGSSPTVIVMRGVITPQAIRHHSGHHWPSTGSRRIASTEALDSLQRGRGSGSSGGSCSREGEESQRRVADG